VLGGLLPTDVSGMSESYDPIPATGKPSTRWLLTKLQRGEITVQEYLKLSKELGKRLREEPMDTSKPQEMQRPKRFPRWN
jgi:hypothetical protein